MKPTSIDPDMTVDEIMRRWPPTIRVMIRHRMLCVGCPIGTFHTVADACAAHGVDEGEFLLALLDAIRNDRVANSLRLSNAEAEFSNRSSVEERRRAGRP
jgi:hybrid cluster-associated redox disulfide protein